MNLALLGVSYKTAPVAVRDALAFSRDEAAAAITQLRGLHEVSECLVLSTCNRTEVLAAFKDDTDCSGVLLEFLAENKSFDVDKLRKYTYVYTGERAVEHLFSVCAGLDSMALGETQVVSQIKDAYELCCSNHCNGPYINRLLHRAFGVSKRVRSSTSIGQGSLSVSFVACDLAKQALGSLEERQAVLVGAGEMGQLTARHLRKRGIGRIRIASRSMNRAEDLAQQFDGDAFPIDELPEQMAQADTIVAATSAIQPVITREMVERAVQNRDRALILIDLGVPRDIDPSVAEVEGAELYNIDDLEEVVETNRTQRSGELENCRNIIQEEVSDFMEWSRSYMASPVIAELQSHFERLRASEVSAWEGKLSDGDIEAVDRATRSLMKKILRHPIVHLVEAAKDEEPVKNMKSVCCILGLHDD